MESLRTLAIPVALSASPLTVVGGLQFDLPEPLDICIMKFLARWRNHGRDIYTQVPNVRE
jgi:hypothetical protein